MDASAPFPEARWLASDTFRIAVHSGPALVGDIGSDAIRNYTDIGDTTKLAARLEAAPGKVLASAATYALLDGPSRPGCRSAHCR
jgi:class 3 adenylate cyclase